jgi:hypothetical protein
MTCTSDVKTRDGLRATADKITDLTMLIQKFPSEARLILDAVEDGLTLGPAQIMHDPCAPDDEESIEDVA